MIIVFGPISMELHLRLDAMPENPMAVFNEDYTLNAGGKAANQALAAARSGAKVAVIGKTGDDDFSKRILDKIRRDGVVTSGVAKSDINHTGLDIIIKLPDGDRRTIKSKGANSEASAEQVPEEILKKNAFVLVQTELESAETISLLQKAKNEGATTLMNLSPTLDLSPEALKNLDYLIVNNNEAEKLAEKLGITIKNNAQKLAQALAKIGDLTCIITMSDKGAVAFTPNASGYSIGALEIDELVDHSGAEDAYCGTLVACLQAGMPLPRAMKRASIAGSLTCMNKGGQMSLPHLADIDERINDIDDAVEI